MSRFPSLFDDLAHDHLRQASVSSSSTSSSRNDLFSLSFEPPLPPPSPVVAGQAASTSNSAANSPILSPRTSSFFDSGSLGTPSPAPRLPPPASSGTSSASRINSTPSFAPSPLSLSRASSRHRKPPPPGVNTHIAGPHEPLSPLHQSPSLSTEELSSWRPPLPAATDEVSLRFSIAPTYMLGEGRYAQVFLAAYKRQSEASSRDETEKETSKTDKEPSINELGDGLTGGSWRLCAAKRMAPDRQSQTMGLREAFFLNRLTGANGPSSHGVRRPRVRDCSPLRYQHDVPITPKRNGSVYIVKLIAVKEDADSTKAYSHSRSSSDALTQAPPKRLNRQRSSTFGMPEGTLSPSASLPALAQAARVAQTPPSVSRLILLLEHAPMGTMDRLLRTSPGLVGKNLWERWARQGASALAWVHEKGVVHADVKPGNLLLTMDLQLRLSDFGSSLLIHPAHPPTDGVGLGTLPFSPPELVDPTRCFSFPVDIFALGATLYQCITGREPFRGCRTIEMMHHVRRGGLWAYEERTRLGKIGSEQPSNAGSPYPSAWRELGINQEGVKRGGSLRVPGGGGDRPRLTRMSSAESLKASEDLVRSETGIDSPAGVKLWAKWMKQPSSVNDAMAALLTEHNHQTGRGLVPIRNGPTRRSIDGTSPTSPTIAESTNEAETVPSLGVPLYPDGTPCMLFLDGETMVDIQVREILKEMLDPDPEARPTAAEILRSWDEMGIDHVEEAL